MTDRIFTPALDQALREAVERRERRAVTAASLGLTIRQVNSRITYLRKKGLFPAAERAYKRPPVTLTARVGEKIRSCLRCRRSFVSEGPGHRVCDACKTTEVWRFAPSMWPDAMRETIDA